MSVKTAKKFQQDYFVFVGDGDYFPLIGDGDYFPL